MREEKKKKNYVLSTMKKLFFSYKLCPYIYKLRKQLLPLVTPLMTWIRLNPIVSISHSLIKN
jgi:hypothetical protein